MAECGEISMMLGAFEDSELEPNEMQEVAYHLARCESCTRRPRRLLDAGTRPEIHYSRAFAGRFLERGNSSRRSPAAAGADENRAFLQASVGVGRLRVRVGRRCRGGRYRDDNSDDAVRRAIRQSRDAADHRRQFGSQRRAGARARSSGGRGGQRAHNGGQRFSCRHLAPRVGEPFCCSLERAPQGHHGHLVAGSALGRHVAASR